MADDDRAPWRARLSAQFIPAIQQPDHTLDSPHSRRHAGLREGSDAAISANHGGAGVKKLVILNLVGLCVVIGLAYLLFQNASSALRTMESLQSVVAAQHDAAEIRVDMIAMSDAMRGDVYKRQARSRARADEPCPRVSAIPVEKV